MEDFVLTLFVVVATGFTNLTGKSFFGSTSGW